MLGDVTRNGVGKGLTLVSRAERIRFDAMAACVALGARPIICPVPFAPVRVAIKTTKKPRKVTSPDTSQRPPTQRMSA